MAFKMKGSPILYGTGKHKSALKANRDSIDNNRHAPARTKDTVDPADIKRREKKNTSKRVPTDKEARAEAVKNLYKSKSPAKKKDNRSLYQKAKDEGKQLAAGAKAAGRVLADRDYFRPVRAAKDAVKAYKKEEKNQAAKRKGGKSSPAKKKNKKEAKTSRSVTKTSGYGLQQTVTQTSSTKKDGKFVRTTTNTADRPLAKEKHEYLKSKGKFPSAQAEADHAKKNKVYSSTVTKQSTKKGKKTFTAADGNPKYMTKTKTKKDGTVKTKKKRYRKNVFKGQPGVRPL